MKNFVFILVAASAGLFNNLVIAKFYKNSGYANNHAPVVYLPQPTKTNLVAHTPFSHNAAANNGYRPVQNQGAHPTSYQNTYHPNQPRPGHAFLNAASNTVPTRHINQGHNAYHLMTTQVHTNIIRPSALPPMEHRRPVPHGFNAQVQGYGGALQFDPLKDQLGLPHPPQQPHTAQSSYGENLSPLYRQPQQVAGAVPHRGSQAVGYQSPHRPQMFRPSQGELKQIYQQPQTLPYLSTVQKEPPYSSSQSIHQQPHPPAYVSTAQKESQYSPQFIQQQPQPPAYVSTAQKESQYSPQFIQQQQPQPSAYVSTAHKESQYSSPPVQGNAEIASPVPNPPYGHNNVGGHGHIGGYEQAVIYAQDNTHASQVTGYGSYENDQQQQTDEGVYYPQQVENTNGYSVQAQEVQIQESQPLRPLDLYSDGWQPMEKPSYGNLAEISEIPPASGNSVETYFPTLFREDVEGRRFKQRNFYPQTI